jgi:hypothetical protein
MSNRSVPNLEERLKRASEAKKLMVAKFKTSLVEGPAAIEKRQQRQAIAAARAERAVQREEVRQRQERQGFAISTFPPPNDLKLTVEDSDFSETKTKTVMGPGQSELVVASPKPQLNRAFTEEERMPDAFTSHHNTYKEHELHMTTNNQDRVKTV